MRSSSFVSREDSTRCLVDFVDSTLLLPQVFPIFSSHFWEFLCNLGHQDQCSKFLSVFEHCRVLASRFPFWFMSILSAFYQFWSILLDTRDLVWWSFVFLSICPRTTHILCRLRVWRFTLKFSPEIFSPYGVFPSQGGFLEFAVSSWPFCWDICHRKYKFSVFLGYQDFFRIQSSGIYFWCIQLFLFFQYQPSGCLLSKFSPRMKHNLKNSLE